MVARTREFANYNNLEHYEYQSFDELLRHVTTTGVHSAYEASVPFDVLFESRAQQDARKPLLVTFHAAIGSNRSYPYFSGRGVAASAAMELLAFSDPTVAISTQIGSNFFLGTSEFDPTRYIEKIIRVVAGDRPLVFLGASAGGFAALKFGNLFPDSATLAMNPVTDLMLNDSFLRTAAKISFPRWSYERIANEREAVIRGAKNRVIYIQNVQDRKFIRTHASRYFASLMRHDNEILLVPGEWGRGHVPVPSAEVVEILDAIQQRPVLEELEKTLGGRIVRGDNASAVLADARLAAYRRRQG